MTRRILLVALAVVLWGTTPPSHPGSDGVGIHWPMGAGLLSAQSAGPSVNGGVGTTLQTFRFSDAEAVGIESITLITTPFAAGVRLGSTVRLEASSTFARGTLNRPEGGSTSVSGLTDTRIQLFTDLVPGRLLVTGQLFLPTGADEFTADELGLVGAVAADLLPFEVSAWGSGGGMGAGVAFFQPMGRLGVGGSVGYTVPGEFSPVQDVDFRYRPGSVLTLQGTVDYTIDVRSRLALQVGWINFQEDEVQGVNLFQSGDRLEARGTWAFAAGDRGSGVAWLGYLHRSEGAFLDDLTTRPSQGLYFAGTGFRQPWRGYVVVPTAELRVQRRDDGADQGTLAGAGLRVEVPVGGALFIPRLQLRGGSVMVREGVDSGFLGLESGFTLRFGGRGS